MKLDQNQVNCVGHDFVELFTPRSKHQLGTVHLLNSVEFNLLFIDKIKMENQKKDRLEKTRKI